MKNFITLLLTKIVQALMIIWMIMFLCAMIIQENALKVHSYVLLTLWIWKTRLRFLRRKINKALTKAWNFIKNLRWSWIFIAYVITIALSIAYKNWEYIDYIWIIPFMLLMTMIGYEVKHPSENDTHNHKHKHQ